MGEKFFENVLALSHAIDRAMRISCYRNDFNGHIAMTNASHADTETYSTTRPLAEDVKQHITTLVGRLNNCNLPLVLEFDVTEEGVEFASLHSSFVCFAIDVSSTEIHMWCDGEDAGHWVDIDSFAAEAEEAAVEAWRVAVVARIPRLVSRKGRQAPTSPL
jgi:hypothetical protein